MSEIARLMAIIVRGTRARRVLQIGTGDGFTGLAIADAIPADGLLITLERDPAVAAAAREAFARARHEQKATVMVGDASRYLHKIAGPFDVVFQAGDVTQYAAMHERVLRLLAPSATLITHGITHAGGYNEVLTADARLTTVMLDISGGIAISVRNGTDNDGEVYRS